MRWKNTTYEWTKWFAWFPVTDKNNDSYWLEYVERKYFNIFGWEFREYKKENIT